MPINFQLATKEIRDRNFFGAIKVYEAYLEKNFDNFIHFFETNTPIIVIGKGTVPITKEHIHSISLEYMDLVLKHLTNDRYLHSLEKEFKIAAIEDLSYYSYSHTIGWSKKHPNQNMASIIAKDPSYILWCVLKLDKFVADPFIFTLESIKCEFSYLQALGINYLKLDRLKKQKKEEVIETDRPRYSDYDTFIDAFDGDIDAWRQFND